MTKPEKLTLIIPMVKKKEEGVVHPLQNGFQMVKIVVSPQEPNEHTIDQYYLRTPKGRTCATLQVFQGAVERCIDPKGVVPKPNHQVYVHQFVVEKKFCITGNVNDTGFLEQEGEIYNVYGKLPNVIKGDCNVTRMPHLRMLEGVKEVRGKLTCDTDVLPSTLTRVGSLYADGNSNLGGITEVVGDAELVFFKGEKLTLKKVGGTLNVKRSPSLINLVELNEVGELQVRNNQIWRLDLKRTGSITNRSGSLLAPAPVRRPAQLPECTPKLPG